MKLLPLTPLSIDSLLVRFLSGTTTQQETEMVNKWLVEGEENSRKLRRVKLIWETSKLLVPKEQPDSYASLQRLTQKISDRKEKRILTNRKFPVIWFKIAAVLLLVTSGYVIAKWKYSYQFGKSLSVKSTETVFHDTLPDGSSVILNKNTILEYTEPILGKKRNLVMSGGEAFFSVSHNTRKPFVILVNELKIVVVGTSFNVKSRGRKTQVIVETGRVQIIHDHDTIYLSANEELLSDPNDRLLQKSMVTDKLYSYYRKKEFIADNTPLWRLVEVLNEAYNAQIVIKNKRLHKLPLNATFKDRSLDDILDIISHTFDIEVIKNGNQIILR